MCLGPSTGHRRRRDDRDDGNAGDDDDDEDGPDDHGPRSRWSVDRLSSIDRQTLSTYPPPRRGVQMDTEAVHDNFRFAPAATAATFADMGSDSEEYGEEDGEEDGGVALDYDYKRIVVGGEEEVVGGSVDYTVYTPPQKRGWQPSPKAARVISG